MHFGEISHLIEGQRGIVYQPHGSRLWHQRCIAHGKSPLRFAHPLRGEAVVISDDGNYALYKPSGQTCAMVC
jgi:hypothetical protein